MAPEQVMGQPVDGRADQYAVGIMAFEMLTGSQPFTADSFGDLVMQQVGAPAPRSVERAPHVPPALDAAIYRMMSKLPDERFATVNEAFRAMTWNGEVPPQSLPTNAAPATANTFVMNASTTGTDTHSIAFAATVAPGEHFALPTGSLPVPIRAEVPPASKVEAPKTAAPAPDQAKQAPIVVPEQTQSAATSKEAAANTQAAATSTQASSNSRSLMMAGIGIIVVLACLVVFLAFRSPDSAKDTRESADDAASQENKASGSSRTTATSTNTSKPASIAGPSTARQSATNSKYRYLLKDGKYPFCVTSKLKQAYPVRTNDEGVKVCIDTPDGPIPVEGLKPYNPYEFQW
jgi:eukaryotic-like serine/threonine-protein kinase